MEENQLPERIITLIKENLLVSALFLFGMIFLVIGLIQLFLPKESEIIVSKSEVKSETTEDLEMAVDVSGEVKSPGVYYLKENSRVEDAINKAGGFTSNANREFISKNINLAAKLTDGLKIYIPSVNESYQVSQNNSNISSNTHTNSPISVNFATSGELESLPGIGPVTASKIIEFRPYSSIEELKTKKAIGQTTFEKIKDQISL